MPILTDENEIRELATQTTKVAEENYSYYHEHFDTLQEEHGGETVAILDGQVVATQEFTDDLEEIRSFINELRDEYDEEDVEEAFITHVPDPDQMLIL